MSAPIPAIAELLANLSTDALWLLKAYMADPNLPLALISDSEILSGRPARELFAQSRRQATNSDLRDRVDWALHFRRQREPKFWIDLFNEIALLLREHGVAPRSALQLGPGNCRVMDVLAYSAGVDEVVSLDAVDATQESTEIYPSLLKYLTADPEKLLRIKGSAKDGLERLHRVVQIENGRVQIMTPFHHGDASRLPFPDAKFDLIFSRATFEHFTEPESAIAEIARTTAPGGWSLHLVDVKDHRYSPFDRSRPEKYLDFLAFADEEWEQRRSDPAYCNRWRANTFRERFVAHGFDEVFFSVEENTAVLPSQRARFLPRFRDRDDLGVLCFWLLCRKRLSRL